MDEAHDPCSDRLRTLDGAVHGLHLPSLAPQLSDGARVERGFPFAIARGPLEAAVAAAGSEPGIDHRGIGGEDQGQIRPVHAVVELPHDPAGYAIKPLQHQRRGEVAIANLDYDTSDVASAVARSPERVMLVSGPQELMEVFSYPFALWRIYLHPAQQRMAHGAFSGPARVTGGPGTGKTVVALHRARHLAESSPKDRSVLVTTFTKTLAGSLEDALRLLIDDETLLRRIDVRHIDQIAYRITAARHGRLPVLSDAEQRDRWSQLIIRFGLNRTEVFLSQEWRHVLLAQGIATEQEYLAAARSGRGRPLSTQARAEIWPALAGFEAQLRSERLWTHEMICVEATRLLERAGAKRYRHIIVDEAQDLSPWQWRMLRAAVPAGADDLFLVGDTHQRIYDHRVSLKQVGIDIAGRCDRLKINYRTTAEILGWSLGLLRGERIDDMNEDLESLAGCRSDVHGAPPVLHGASTRSAEMEHLVQVIRSWLGEGVQRVRSGSGPGPACSSMKPWPCSPVRAFRRSRWPSGRLEMARWQSQPCIG